VKTLVKKVVVRDGRIAPVFPTANAIRRELARAANPCVVSKQTICSDLRALGYVARVRPKVTTRSPQDYAARLAFVKKAKRVPSKRLVFCDEKLFTSNEMDTYKSWNLIGEPAYARETKRFPPGRCLVWACIGHNFRQVVVLPERAAAGDGPFRLSAQTYVRRCLAPMVPHLQANPSLLFVQDGAGCHAARSTQAYLQRKGVKCLEGFPARSPDLNPIENYWAHLQRKVSARLPRDRAELMDAINAAWAEDGVAVANAMVGSFSRRCARVESAGGAQAQR
jgi:transposase